MTTIIAEISIYGSDLNPQYVTDALGLEPTKNWSKGDIRSRRTNSVYEYGCWKTCTEESTLPLEEHLRVLKQKIADRTDVVRSFADSHGCEIELSVVVRVTDEEAPDISVSRAALSWLYNMRASLDFDTYF